MGDADAQMRVARSEEASRESFAEASKAALITASAAGVLHLILSRYHVGYRNVNFRLKALLFG